MKWLHQLRRTLAGLRPANMRRLILSLFLVLFAGGALATFSFYSQRLRQNVGWTSRVKIQRETRLVGSVFQLAHTLVPIYFEHASGRILIRPPPCEERVLKVPAGIDENERNAALDLLCSSPQGDEVRAEIEQWNASYDFVAVRDNRSPNLKCDASAAGESALKSDVYIPYGCKLNAWQVEQVWSDGSLIAAWTPGAEPPPSEYGFIVHASDPARYEGDWARVSPANDQVAAHYRLSTEITLPPDLPQGWVTIDVIGRLRSISIDGGPSQEVYPREPETPVPVVAPGLKINAWIDCDEEDQPVAADSIEDPDDNVETISSNAQTDNKTAPEAKRLSDCKPVPAGALTQRRSAGTFASIRAAEKFVAKSRLTQQHKAKVRTAPHAAYAYQLDIARASGARELRTVKVTLDVDPATNLPRVLRRGNDGYFTLSLTRHLRATCREGWRQPDGASAACTLTWNRINDLEERGRPDLHIMTGCGTGSPEDLVAPDTAIITPEAFDKGLSPLVGLGPLDWGSLTAAAYASGFAGRKTLPCPSRLAHKTAGQAAAVVVPLTIDPKLQKNALDALVASQGCLSPRAQLRTRRRASAVALDAQRQACDARRYDQSAAIVLLDADEEPGAIRAVASWPPTPKHLHLWDLNALDQGAMVRAGPGWRANTADNVPGSTFKAVTSVAAITAVTVSGLFAGPPDQKSKLAALLQGGTAEADADTFLGVHKAPISEKNWVTPDRRKQGCEPDQSPSKGKTERDTIPVPSANQPRWCARNFHFEPFWDAKPPARTTCPDNVGGRPQFGMCEALIYSSNLFFGGVARRLSETVKSPNQDEIFLANVARRLSFGLQVLGRADDCGPSSGKRWLQPPGTVAGYDLARGLVPAPKLFADPIRLTAGNPACRISNPAAVVRNGFGDQVTATPLAMATVYASLAKRQIVRPTLITVPRRAGCPVDKSDPDECGPLIQNSVGAEPFFDALRRGLHAVPKVGTAKRAFAATKNLLDVGDVPRLFLKTGTATVAIARGGRFSLWATGWIEGVVGTGVPKRLAFACIVTHRSAKDVGGDVCGPIIRDLMVKLDAEPAL